MARKKRRYVARIYIPRQRGLLGPRHRLKLAEVEHPFDYHALTARWLHGHQAGVETVAQAMPKGGTRIMARCPQCLALRRDLYVTPFLRCRVCCGKFYRSRDGYRPRSRLTEAHRQAFEDRLEFAEYQVALKGVIAVARSMASLFTYFAQQAEQDERRQHAVTKHSVRRTAAETKRLRALRREIKRWTSVQQAYQEALLAAQPLRRAA